jgi:hypothetical protein
MIRRALCQGSEFPTARDFRLIHMAAACAAACAVVSVFAAAPLPAQQPARNEASPPAAQHESAPASAETSGRQAELEATFEKMLTGATLEGSFTSTGRGSDLTKLRSEKYTIGAVKKLAPGVWMISARIQYGEHDVTLPIAVPIRWAGDTPVIVVDNQALPGFGTVSARVMFFADHYAGYWKHGDHGGHLFGIISRDGEAAADQISPDDDRSPSRSSDNSSRGDAPGR